MYTRDVCKKHCMKCFAQENECFHSYISALLHKYCSMFSSCHTREMPEFSARWGTQRNSTRLLLVVDFLVSWPDPFTYCSTWFVTGDACHSLVLATLSSWFWLVIIKERGFILLS